LAWVKEKDGFKLYATTMGHHNETVSPKSSWIWWPMESLGLHKSKYNARIIVPFYGSIFLKSFLCSNFYILKMIKNTTLNFLLFCLFDYWTHWYACLKDTSLAKVEIASRRS
jgi:hypothetical protein